MEVALDKAKKKHKLPKDIVRRLHFFEAADKIFEEIKVLRKTNSKAAKAFEEYLHKTVVDLHHHPTRKGVMQLVERAQHMAPELADLFHPKDLITGRRRGGMSLWGYAFSR
jgi:hypothetical protein